MNDQSNLTILPLTKEDVTAVVGKNADYYWARWTPLMQGQNWTSFNWPAFFFTGFWLAYRKMYNLALIFFVIILLGVLADHVNEGRKESFASIFGWIIGLICGAGGNRWYWSHASRLVDQARGQDLTETQTIDLLARRGGTSVLSAVIFLVIFFALSFVIVSGVR